MIQTIKIHLKTIFVLGQETTFYLSYPYVYLRDMIKQDPLTVLLMWKSISATTFELDKLYLDTLGEHNADVLSEDTLFAPSCAVLDIRDFNLFHDSALVSFYCI